MTSSQNSCGQDAAIARQRDNLLQEKQIDSTHMSKHSPTGRPVRTPGVPKAAGKTKTGSRRASRSDHKRPGASANRQEAKGHAHWSDATLGRLVWSRTDRGASARGPLHRSMSRNDLNTHTLLNIRARAHMFFDTFLTFPACWLR